MPITTELQASMYLKPAIRRVSTISAAPRRKEKLRVAAYCRVSTDYIEQEGSIEAQQTHMEEAIDANPEWENAGVYCESGVSGTKAEERPELQRLLRDCEGGRIDLVLTKSISRFARNAEDCLRMVRQLNEQGVGIIFEKEALDTRSQESEFFLSILATLAENESRSLSQNVAWGYRKRFERGEFKYNRPPYGYDAVDGQLVVNPREAIVIREIFDFVLEGKGFEAIAKILNARGIRSKTGKIWQQGTVRKIIGNITYTGTALFQKYYIDDHYKERPNRGELNQYLVENHHEAIIPAELFQKAADAVAERRGRYHNPTLEEDAAVAQKRTRRGPLSGMVYCGECGGVLHRYVRHKREGEREHVWVCSNRRKGRCTARQIREEELLEQCREMLDGLATRNIRPLEDYIERAGDSTESRRRMALMEELRKNRNEQERLAALGEGATRASLFTEKRVRLYREAEEIRRELARTSEDDALRKARSLKKFLVNGADVADRLDEALMQHIQRLVVRPAEGPGGFWLEMEFRCGLCLR